MTVTIENIDYNFLNVLKSLVKLQPKAKLKTDGYSDEFAQELLKESRQAKEDIKNGVATIYPNMTEAIKALNE